MLFTKRFLLLIILLISSQSTKVIAFPEIAFCPAGGPPGWMNYFDNRRKRDYWQNYYRYSYYYPPAYTNYYFWPQPERQIYYLQSQQQHQFTGNQSPQ